MSLCLTDTKEKSNGTKLSRLLIDGGTEALRSTFDRIHPPRSLIGTFHSYLPLLTDLRRKRILNSSQWDKLFTPTGVAPDSKQFDITLLYILLRNICGLTPPATGWDKLPPETDTTLEANLARIKYYRNQVHGHISNTSVEDSNFEAYWKEISCAMVALGLDQVTIDLLKSAPLGTEDYIKLLEEWSVEEQAVKEVADKARKAASVATEEARETRSVAERAIKVVEQIKLEAEKTGNAIECLRAEFSELKHSSLSNRVEPSKERSVLLNLAKCDFTGQVMALSRYRYPGTRQWLLNELQQLFNNDQEQVVVITAQPGVGKSVIAAVTCQAMYEQGKLAACHFIEHDNSLRNTPKHIIESLASHLCDRVVGFEKKLEERLSRNMKKELSSMSCNELFTLLVEEPLNAVNKPSGTALVVIDALDEIDQTKKDEFVRALFRVAPKLPRWVKLMVTSRPMPSVIPKLSFVTMIDIDTRCNNNMEDIQFYLESHLQEMYREETAEERQKVATTLTRISDGIFLFAHFAVDITKLSKPKLSQVDKLFPNGISSVYEEYLSRLIKNFPIEENTFFSFLEALLATECHLPKALAFQILNVSGSSRRDRKIAQETERCLSHLFPVHNECFTVFHKSLMDWLLDDEQESHDFILKKIDGHRVLAPLCPQLLQSVKNHEDFPSALNECETYVLRYGFHHMLAAGGFEAELKMFATDLELLSIMLSSFHGSTYRLLDILKTLISVLKWHSAHLDEFLTELTYFCDVPCTKYSQVVFQAAANCSEENELRKQSKQLLGTSKYHHLPWIEFIQEDWELPRDVCWIDDFKLTSNTKIALCIGEMSDNQSFVATFNTETGKCIVDAVREEVAFRCAISSVDNCANAAVTTDSGVKIIDIETLQTLEVISAKSVPFGVCFLSHGTQLAVGYRDNAVRVWDLRTFKLKTQLIGHTGVVILCLQLLNDCLLTGDWCGTLLLWKSIEPVPRVIKLTDCCWSRDWSTNKETVAVSPDKTRIAALCRSDVGGCVVNLFSAHDGRMLMQVMEGNRCAISFIDNSHVLCGEFGELKIMNINSREVRKPKGLFCPHKLQLRSSPYQITASEFVACFNSSLQTKEKPMGFRLHNIE